MALRIRVLLENHKGAGADKSLKARPGLSLLVEDESTSILFDTGPDGSFMQNDYGMRASGDRKYCPALSEHYRYKADLRACRRISSPLRITVHAVASQALSARTQT